MNGLPKPRAIFALGSCCAERSDRFTTQFVFMHSHALRNMQKRGWSRVVSGLLKFLSC